MTALEEVAMSRPRELALFTFIDAFGWEILKRNSFLDDVLVTKEPLETIFGYSSTCDPTILTGLLPRDHGHFSFYYYSPKTSPFGVCRALGLLPRFLTRRGRVRNVLSRFLKRFYGYTGYFQIYGMPFDKIRYFDYSEKRDIYEPGGINGGQPVIFDWLREKKIPFYKSDWRAPEETNLAVLEEAIDEGEIRFAYLYMAAMDAILHQYGAASEQGAAKIRWYEEQIRRVLDRAHQNYDEVHIYLFSDHGMTDTIDVCPLIERVDALGLRFGTDYAAVYDSTMARFWFLSDRAREAIPEALRAEPKGRILTEKDLHRFGCDFSDRKYGDLFFLMNPGVLLCPSYMSEAYIAAMHGYTPEDKDSTAMFASNVVPDPMPKRLDDLYGLMVSEMSGRRSERREEILV